MLEAVQRRCGEKLSGVVGAVSMFFGHVLGATAVAGAVSRWRARTDHCRQPRDASIAAAAQRAVEADREVVLAAVARHGLALEFAVPELRGDAEVLLLRPVPSLFLACSLHEVVLKAIGQDGNAFQFASMELRCNRDFVLRLGYGR